jgi:putative transcriptional regulator
MSKKVVNRLKVTLAEQFNKNEATISRWCTNVVQPPVKTLVTIVEVLDVKLTKLLND